MKLWEWEQDDVIDSDMKAMVIGVQTKMQTFTFFNGLQLTIEVLSHSENLYSSHQRAELWAVDAERNAKLSVTIFLGYKPPLDQGRASCFEVGVTSPFIFTSL